MQTVCFYSDKSCKGLRLFIDFRIFLRGFAHKFVDGMNVRIESYDDRHLETNRVAGIGPVNDVLLDEAAVRYDDGYFIRSSDTCAARADGHDLADGFADLDAVADLYGTLEKD